MIVQNVQRNANTNTESIKEKLNIEVEEMYKKKTKTFEKFFLIFSLQTLIDIEVIRKIFIQNKVIRIILRFQIQERTSDVRIVLKRVCLMMFARGF